MATNQTEKSELKMDASTTLAVERTRVSYDRTMMAWIRTSTSLITFGFTIYKFFQIELQRGLQPSPLIGPREFGLTMVCIGLASLLLATFENRQNMQALRASYSQVRVSKANVLAGMIALLGILALVVMLLRA